MPSDLTPHSFAGKKQGLPLSVWAVFFACIIAFMGLGLVDPILPSLSGMLKATPSEVALLFTSYNAVMAVAMLVTGFLSSRMGTKLTLLLGVFVIAAFASFGAAAQNIWVLVGLRGFWGFGNALFVATALAAIVTYSNRGTERAVILYEAAIGIGISVGPLLGGTLGSLAWQGPFLGVGVLMLFAFVFLALFMPSPKRGAESSGSTTTSFFAPFWAMRHRPILLFGLAACLYNIGFFTLLAYVPFVLGLDARGIGFVFVGWGLLLALNSVFVAPLIKRRFGTIRGLTGILLLFVLVLLTIGIWTGSQEVVISAMVFSGALMGNINTLLTAAVMKAAPVEKATASAAYSFLRFIGSAISPFMAGKLAEVFSPSVPFLVGAAFVFLAVLLVRFNHRHLAHVDRTSDHGSPVEKDLEPQTSEQT